MRRPKVLSCCLRFVGTLSVGDDAQCHPSSTCPWVPHNATRCTEQANLLSVSGPDPRIPSEPRLHQPRHSPALPPVPAYAQYLSFF